MNLVWSWLWQVIGAVAPVGRARELPMIYGGVKELALMNGAVRDAAAMDGAVRELELIA